MKDYIEERAVEIAGYIVETKATVRQAAKKFGISKSTVHIVVMKLNDKPEWCIGWNSDIKGKGCIYSSPSFMA